MKTLRIITMLFIMLIALSCAKPAANGQVFITEVYTPGSSIFRHVDCDAEVVCWSRDTSNISCLPIKETALALENQCRK